MVIDLIEPLAKLFEPWPGNPTTDPEGNRSIAASSGVTVDLNGAQPFTYAANTLYAWATSEEHPLNESANPPKELEVFEVAFVFVADAGDEEPKQRRRRTVSDALDAKAHSWLDLIRRNRSRYEGGAEAPWHHLAGRLDPDLVRNFNARGIALRVSGYRYV